MTSTAETITGASIIADMLCADPAMLAAVAVGNIKLAVLPANITLPAVLVRTISNVERQTLRRGGTVRTIDRVSVTVRAASYRDQTRIIKLITDCCAGKTGQIGGGRNVSILTAGRGPDLNGPGNSFEQAQDFRVSHDA